MEKTHPCLIFVNGILPWAIMMFFETCNQPAYPCGLMLAKESMARNFMTFDIEEWYHANYAGSDFYSYEGKETLLESEVDTLIDLCAKFQVKATCFILGKVAQQKPKLVKKLHAAGHEIASHGTSHALVYELSPQTFAEDLRESCDQLEQLTGQEVCGFRAPSWSLKREHLGWYYAALERQGLLYSSSVYPAQTFLYGIPGFPTIPHYPMVDGKQQRILEIPVPVISVLGKKVGFSGGFYLRFFPAWFVTRMLRKQNQKGKDCFLYLHPREINPASPRLPLPLMQKLIHYWGMKRCAGKLEALLKVFAGGMTLMADYAKEKQTEQAKRVQ